VDQRPRGPAESRPGPEIRRPIGDPGQTSSPGIINALKHSKHFGPLGRPSGFAVEFCFGFANGKSESARDICREHVCEVGGEVGREVGREKVVKNCRSHFAA